MKLKIDVRSLTCQEVAPRAGAWIETSRLGLPNSNEIWSPPARGRGLKPSKKEREESRFTVAPRAGAWIETLSLFFGCNLVLVAPRAGAWIETTCKASAYRLSESPSARGRGLKP